MNGAEYLRKVGDAIKEIQALDRKIALCRMKADATPDTSFSDEPRGTSNGGSREAPFVRWVYKALELEGKCGAKAAELDSMKEETVRLIGLIPDATKQMVLAERYVEAKSWSEIASDVGYSKTHVYRLHEECMWELERVEAKDGS